MKRSRQNLAIITVNYKNYSVTQDFLESLEKQSLKNFKVYVVDVSEPIQKIPKKPFLEVVYDDNRGYAHGVNIGLKRALNDDFSFFCIINNDTLVDNFFSKRVTKSLAANGNAVIAGKIYYAPGFEYHKNRYEKENLGKIFWYAGGEVNWNNAVVTHRGVDEVDIGQFNMLEKTGFVSGCLMCFDKSIVDKVGFFDENYFMYFEDADFCERSKRAGVNLYYDPSIVIWHKNAQSTGGSGSDFHQKWQKQSQLRFAIKY